MEYYIFRIKEEFKGVIDETILCSIFEKEHNEYYYSQLKYILSDISWNKLIETAKIYFKDRNDIIISDFSIIYKRLIEDKNDELIITNNSLRLHLESELSPLLTFLEEFNECFIYVKKEQLEFAYPINR